jgi:hypothetical protein
MTDTIRTLAYLTGTEAPDTTPDSGYTLQYLRDFMVSVAASTVRSVRIVTASGAVAALSNDSIIILSQTIPAAATVNLYASPVLGQQVTIKDGDYNASLYSITIVPASGNIDGAASFILSNNGASVDLIWNGSNWNVV